MFTGFKTVYGIPTKLLPKVGKISYDKLRMHTLRKQGFDAKVSKHCKLST